MKITGVHLQKEVSSKEEAKKVIIEEMMFFYPNGGIRAEIDELDNGDFKVTWHIFQ